MIAPHISEANVPGVAQALASATEPVIAKAGWQSCGMK